MHVYIPIYICVCICLKSYIKSTIDFLNSIPENIDPNTLIATFDVTNLYSNIPHEL